MKKMRAGLKLFILAFAMLMMPIFAQKVSAEEQVKIELTYIYVNETGGNSLYIDTEYVPAGTTWGTFFETYQKCYEDGTIADVDENNAWKVRVQQVNYSSTDSYYANTITNFNAYTDCALVTYFGCPETYQRGYFSFEYYEDEKCKDSGTGWDMLLPNAYAYGSEEAVNYVLENAVMYDYIDDYFAISGVDVGVEAFLTQEEVEAGRMQGYNLRFSVTTSMADIFEDVETGAWYEPYVKYVYVNELMVGKAENTFDVTGNLTRAEFATILYKIAGRPALMLDRTFSDVEIDSWYEAPVYWTAENGIATGYGEGIFGVTDPITREQLALMLYKFSGETVVDSTGTVLDGFNDTAQISDYAVEAVTWAVENGIISGTDVGDLNPEGHATRAEAATMITQFMNRSSNS